MQNHEREQLTRFLEQLTNAPAPACDAEAGRLIGEACARQPHAAYLLVQRTLLLEHALQDSRQQVEQLRAELEQARRPPAASGSFLGGDAWGNGATMRPAAVPAPVPGYASVAAAPVPAGSSAPSWLGNVATTAAGVVAGSFLFQGIEHLLGGGHAGASGLFGGSDPQARGMGENTVVNNFFESGPSAADDGAFADLADLGTPDDDSWI